MVDQQRRRAARDRGPSCGRAWRRARGSTGPASRPAPCRAGPWWPARSPPGSPRPPRRPASTTETRVGHGPGPARGSASDQAARAVVAAARHGGGSSRSGRRAPTGRGPSTIDQADGPARSGTAGLGSTAAQRIVLPGGSSTVSRRPLSGTTSYRARPRTDRSGITVSITSASGDAGGVVRDAGRPGSCRAATGSARPTDGASDAVDAGRACRRRGRTRGRGSVALEDRQEPAAGRWRPPRPAAGRSRSRCAGRRSRPPACPGAPARERRSPSPMSTGRLDAGRTDASPTGGVRGRSSRTPTGRSPAPTVCRSSPERCNVACAAQAAGDLEVDPVESAARDVVADHGDPFGEVGMDRQLALDDHGDPRRPGTPTRALPDGSGRPPVGEPRSAAGATDPFAAVAASPTPPPGDGSGWRPAGRARVPRPR